MPISYLACFSACIGPKISKAPGSDWRRYPALSKNMEAACGPTRNWTAAQLSISHSAAGNIACREMQLRLREGNPLNGLVDILLVEDSQDDMDLALHALRHEKLANSIFVVRDGEEALDFLFCRGTFAQRDIDHPPKLVLLDL